MPAITNRRIVQMLKIYNTDYNEVDEGEDGDGFTTIGEAAKYVFKFLPSDDFPYMIGTAQGIVAFVFQGSIYVNPEVAG